MRPLNTIRRPILPSAPLQYDAADQQAFRKAIADALERGTSDQSAYPLSQKGVVQCYLTLDSLNNPIFLAADGETVLANMAVFIQVKAEQLSKTATTVTVRVTVTDFLDVGGNHLVITPTAVGCTVSPNTASAALPTAGFVDYTITKPGANSGQGRVIFAAVDTNGQRLPNFDVVDVEQQATTGLQIKAVATSTTTTTVNVDVTVTDPFDQGGAYLVITPTAVGCTVSPSTASSAQVSGSTVSYAITRPSANSGAGRVVFTASDNNGNRISQWDAVDVNPQDTIVPTINVSVTPSATSYSVAFTSTGTVTYQVDAGGFSAATSPIVVTRNAIGGADQVLTLKAVLNGQTETNSITVPAQVLGSISLTGVIATKVDATHFTVNWTDSGMPSGTTYNITWSVDGITPGGNSDANAEGSNPVSITLSSGSMGATPSGSVTVDAIYGGKVIATKKKNGAFAL